MKVTIDVQSWTDDPMCPKCLRCVDKSELRTAAFNHIVLDGENILTVTCRSCGHTHLMQTADAEE